MRLTLPGAMLLALLICTGPVRPSEADGRLLLIQRVSVVDARSSKPRAPMDVLIRFGRIVSVTKTRYPFAFSGTHVVDGKGKYLIPGLWDMHVHGSGTPGFAGIYLANGVTGIRDMFDMTGATFSLREAIRSGKAIGPHIVAAGRPIDGPKPYWPGSLTASTAYEGRQAVRAALNEGSDFIKVYSLLPRKAFFGVAAEAKRQNVPFEGHTPESVTAIEASDAGLKSNEHLYGILRECSPAFKAPVNLFEGHATAVRFNTLWLKTYDPKLAAKLFARLRKNGTYQTPTLSVWYFMDHPEDPRKGMQSRFDYMPAGFKERFEKGRLARFRNWKPADFAFEAVMFKKYLELVGAMNRAGVPILAGTDVMNPYCFPGFGIHDELHWLVQAGLSPWQALKSATLTPAEFFGIQKTLGTVEGGKIADCVLLDANPLTNIDNATKIAAVIRKGQFFDRAALSHLMPKHPHVTESDVKFPAGIGEGGE